uniref:Transposase n=1 Tax=Globodera pallida TaxID=36090 RepID=A0A183CPJ4_GLOPA
MPTDSKSVRLKTLAHVMAAEIRQCTKDGHVREAFLERILHGARMSLSVRRILSIKLLNRNFQ